MHALAEVTHSWAEVSGPIHAADGAGCLMATSVTNVSREVGSADIYTADGGGGAHYRYALECRVGNVSTLLTQPRQLRHGTGHTDRFELIGRPPNRENIDHRHSHKGKDDNLVTIMAVAAANYIQLPCLHALWIPNQKDNTVELESIIYNPFCYISPLWYYPQCYGVIIPNVIILASKCH